MDHTVTGVSPVTMAAAARFGARWPRLREGERKREEVEGMHKLTPEAMARTARHGEAGRWRNGDRRRRPEVEKTRPATATAGLPARFTWRGGRGAQGGAHGGVGVGSGGRSRRRLERPGVGVHGGNRLGFLRGRSKGERREQGQHVGALLIEAGGPGCEGAGVDMATAGHGAREIPVATGKRES